jgi:hypothetical protein
MIDDDPSGTDVVNEIFARLRKATLEERGAAPVPTAQGRAAGQGRDATGELFERRDAALAESLAALTRKVKRALQDDQNIMLERLRDVKAMITTELEDEHEQRARYADAAIDALARTPPPPAHAVRQGRGRRAPGAALETAPHWTGLRGRPGGDDRAGAAQEDPHRRQRRRPRASERGLQGVARRARRTTLHRRRAAGL